MDFLKSIKTSRSRNALLFRLKRFGRLYSCVSTVYDQFGGTSVVWITAFVSSGCCGKRKQSSSCRNQACGAENMDHSVQSKPPQKEHADRPAACRPRCRSPQQTDLCSHPDVHGGVVQGRRRCRRVDQNADRREKSHKSGAILLQIQPVFSGCSPIVSQREDERGPMCQNQNRTHSCCAATKEHQPEPNARLRKSA